MDEKEELRKEIENLFKDKKLNLGGFDIDWLRLEQRLKTVTGWKDTESIFKKHEQ